MTYRVVQVGIGNVGRQVLPRLVRSPECELVGVGVRKGGTPFAETATSLELFAEHVMPEFATSHAEDRLLRALRARR